MNWRPAVFLPLLLCPLTLLAAAIEEIPFYAPPVKKQVTEPVRAELKSEVEYGREGTSYHEFVSQIPLTTEWWGPEGHDNTSMRIKTSFLDTRHNFGVFEDYTIPHSLYDLQAGFNFGRYWGEKRSWGGSFTAGSASNRPFRSYREMTLQGSVTYKFPHQNDSILLMLNYSNNRAILNNWPLPGFLYMIKWSEAWGGAFGFPMEYLWWKPVPEFSAQAMIFIPYLMQVRASYSLDGPLTLYALYNTFPKTYLIYGRENTKERLFFDERKFSLGLKGPIRKAIVDVCGGMAVSRRFYQATSYTKRNDLPKKLRHAIFMAGEVRFSF
jgi:hypothetical protein